VTTSEDQCKSFRKNSDGSWTCVSKIRIAGPLARSFISPGITFRPGQLFLGIDVVATLEASCGSHEAK